VVSSIGYSGEASISKIQDHGFVCFLISSFSFLHLIGKYTPQYKWLEEELPKVNRTETPWLIVLVHSPWYNSYNYHYMEGETMRVMYEPWFVQYKVDMVFAGHVHAYERTVCTTHPVLCSLSENLSFHLL